MFYETLLLLLIACATISTTVVLAAIGKGCNWMDDNQKSCPLMAAYVVTMACSLIITFVNCLIYLYYTLIYRQNTASKYDLWEVDILIYVTYAIVKIAMYNWYWISVKRQIANKQVYAALPRCVVESIIVLIQVSPTIAIVTGEYSISKRLDIMIAYFGFDLLTQMIIVAIWIQQLKFVKEFFW